MNLNKHLEFFDPTRITTTVHIIGLGAIGSHVALMLTRLGFTRFRLYEFDTVTPHNLANQVYDHADIHKPKLDLTAAKMLAINPELELTLYEGYKDHNLFGYVFLCADSIALRRGIVEQNLDNERILSMTDFRMRLADAQHYMANWTIEKDRTDLLATMQFTREEAEAATPVSACGTTLSIIPTVWTITALGIANFINLYKGQPYKKMMIIDSFLPDLVAF